jgi:hypothetical protein
MEINEGVYVIVWDEEPGGGQKIEVSVTEPTDEYLFNRMNELSHVDEEYLADSIDDIDSLGRYEELAGWMFTVTHFGEEEFSTTKHLAG